MYRKNFEKIFSKMYRNRFFKMYRKNFEKIFFQKCRKNFFKIDF
uniref:Uncharacterized protein n=1 Tax=viral metagenome TaxID=1070528 RepID=A0A6C0IDS9_9ZZZZ